MQATGAEAQEAFEQWASGFDLVAEYPVQVSWVCTTEMVQKVESLGLDQQIQMDIGFNFILKDTDSLLGWGNMAMDANLPELEETLELGFQLGIDSDGFRLLLSPNDAVLDFAPVEIPTAYQLSASRVEILSNMWAQFTEEAMQMSGFEEATEWMDYESLFEVFHPTNMLEAYVDNPFQEVVDWQVEGDQVRMTFAPRMESLSKEMIQAQGEAGMELLQQMRFDIIADLHTGAAIEVSMDVVLPISDLVPSSQADGFEMTMKMEMSMLNVPVEENPPALFLPAEDKILHLDQPFDDFLPALESLMQMQIQTMKKMAGETEAGDDFSF